VVLTSSGYKWAPESGIEFDNLAGERDYTPNKMYGQSKLANHLYVRQLAKNLAGSTATANSVHPGVIMTNLGRSFPRWQQVAARLIGWTFMKSVEAGTATTCYVATAPALATISGHYFADCNPETPGGNMENDALAAKLWAVSEELTRPYLLGPDVGLARASAPREKQRAQWLAENRTAVEAYNDHVEKHGVFSDVLRSF
jgi:NAD(P)-dependent dehydrogenase (short-subunit alcohol dehydrogenase family)